jgi:hypothetical protein
MISESVVHAATAAVYAVAAVVCVWSLRQADEANRRYLRLATVPVVVGIVSSALLGLGVGSVVVDGYELTIPAILSDTVAYPVLWAVTAMLADVEDRLVAFAAVVPFVQVLAFWASPVYGGLVALASVAVVVGSHVLLAVVFRGRIWAASSSVAEERRLLHWKARNLLLFLIGMLIAFAFLSVAGAFDDFGTLVIDQYISVLIRIGFVGFLFANVDALGTVTDAATTAAVGRDTTAADDD